MRVCPLSPLPPSPIMADRLVFCSGTIPSHHNKPPRVHAASQALRHRCLRCGIELGMYNMRQLCGKITCHATSHILWAPPSPPPLSPRVSSSACPTSSVSDKTPTR